MNLSGPMYQSAFEGKQGGPWQQVPFSLCLEQQPEQFLQRRCLASRR